MRGRYAEMPDTITNKLGTEIMVGGIRFKSNVLMAPLAGYTCFPFRLMAERLGAGSAYTEMVSSDGLKYNDRATSKLLYTDDREKLKCVQLLGSIPAVFERAAKSERLEKFDVIDVNMGCPVPNVIKAGEGSALLEDLPRASKIIEACKRSGKVVSVKCRIGLNRQKIVIEEFARMCEQSGADMITVHGRTRDMMYDGEPLYEFIKKAKESVKIPVFANGGIDSKAKALEMMEKTGADGVMLARYGFENPLIFAELTGTQCNDTKYSLLMEQLEIAEECYDELYVLSYVKKLASYFMKKLPGTKQYKLALYRCGSISELRTILGEIFTAPGE
jgi:nifR3 family TIM-barrel protein